MTKVGADVLMSSCVLDCSVAMKWCFGEEATEVSRALLALLEDKAAFVPSHWYLEVANTLAMAIRKSRIPEKQAAEFLRLLRELAIYSDPLTSTLAFEDTFMLAKKYNLTTYDAAYLGPMGTSVP